MGFRDRFARNDPRSWAVALLAVALVSLALHIYVDWLWRDQVRTNAPLLDNTKRVRLYLANGRLWLEELLSGDESIRIEQIWLWFDRALQAVDDCLEGKSSFADLRGKPLTDPELAEKFTRLKAAIKQFWLISVKRWKDQERPAADNVIEEEFQSAFLELDLQADAVDELVRRHITQSIKMQENIHTLTLALWSAILAGACAALWFASRRPRPWVQALEAGEIGPPEAAGEIPGAPTMTGRRRRKIDEQSVRHALRQAGGNKVEAARILGVSRATLYRFMSEFMGDEPDSP